MAIVTENYVINGRQFVRTYSDAGRYVVGGDPYGEYTEANDPAEFGRVYNEGGSIPPEEREDTLEAKAEAYDILMGVSE